MHSTISFSLSLQFHLQIPVQLLLFLLPNIKSDDCNIVISFDFWKREALSASSNSLEVAKGISKVWIAQVQDFLCLIFSKEFILVIRLQCQSPRHNRRSILKNLRGQISRSNKLWDTILLQLGFWRWVLGLCIFQNVFKFNPGSFTETNTFSLRISVSKQ